MTLKDGGLGVNLPPVSSSLTANHIDKRTASVSRQDDILKSGDKTLSTPKRKSETKTNNNNS